MLKVLVACEESQRVCTAFREKGDKSRGKAHSAKLRSKTFEGNFKERYIMIDTLEKTIHEYVDKHNVEYGQYVAVVKVIGNNFTFRVAFEHYVDVDDNGNTYEYVDIFKGRKEGTYCGEYSIKYIECLQRDY